MFHIKFDWTNIILLAAAGLLAMWSIFVPVPAGGFFPLFIALLLIVYIRSIYFTSRKKTALICIGFLLIPVVLYTLYRLVNSGTPASTVVLKALPWIIILFLALELGLLLLASSIRVIPSAAGIINQWEVSDTLRAIKKHFGFMLEKGYTISDLYYVDHLPYGGWHFQLDSPDDKASIIFDEQRAIMLDFGKGRTDEHHQIVLEALIYHLTGRRIYGEVPSRRFPPGRSKGINDEAIILRSYIDQIEKYLHDHPEITDKELINITEQYGDLLYREYEQRNKTAR